MKYYESDMRNLFEKSTLVFSKIEIIWIMGELLTVLEYLHDRNIIHRDIKPSNVLVNTQGRIMITDFDLCRDVNDQVGKLTGNLGTRWYRAPELIFGSTQYGKEVDIWSLGCTFAELVKKKPIFVGATDIDQLGKIFEVIGTPEQNNFHEVSKYPFYFAFKEKKIPNFDAVLNCEDEEICTLIRSMLEIDPSKRPRVNELLKMDLFKNMDKESKQDCMQKLANKVKQLTNLGTQ